MYKIQSLLQKNLQTDELLRTFVNPTPHTTIMDPILRALRDYRLHASPEQKAADLKRLETECIAGVDAFAYLHHLARIEQATHRPHR